MHLAVGLCLFLISTNTPLLAQSPAETGQVLTGRPLQSVIDKYRGLGLPIVYSTNLVSESLEVQAEPTSTDPVSIVREILAPHRLELRQVEDVLLIVRSAAPAGDIETATATVYFVLRTADTGRAIETAQISARTPLAGIEQLGRGTYRVEIPADRWLNIDINADGFLPLNHRLRMAPASTSVVRRDMILGPAELADMIISTSRYRLSRELLNSVMFFDQRAIESLPDVGDDPLRAVHRLPGAAAGGFSAKSHFRGGEQDETAIFLNGLRLLDPFHVRDYQSIFSAIDVRAIEGIEVYTGGFPIAYGDRMSGLVLIDSQQPEKPIHTELGLSVFNTSVLNTGYTADNRFDWLVSARSSNLDLVLQPSVGEPSYNDIFAQAGIQFNANTRLSINVLSASDSVLVITENEQAEREQSDSQTRNFHFWARLDNIWTARLSSSTVVSSSSFRNARLASIKDPEVILADVTDIRKVDSLGIRQDWRFNATERHLLQWGLLAEKSRALYDYTGVVSYFGFKAAFAGQPDSIERSVRTVPSGYAFGLYIADRWQLGTKTIAELGLRWDKQSYTRTPADDQLSPRFSLLHSFSKNLDLRLSWGRYWQSQGIHELQVEDGVDRFFPAQRADHLIAGFQFRLMDFYALRVEAFHKDFARLKPRYENLHDSLALIPELQPDRVLVAPDSSRAYGLEVSLDYRGPAELRWWGSYTLAKTTDEIHGVSVPRSWDQRHALHAGLGWNRGPWEIGIAATYRTGWPTTGLEFELLDDEDFVVTPGPRNTLRLGEYSSFDFRVSREFDLRLGKLSAFFELSNAFNRKNPCCVDYDTTDSEDDPVELDKSFDNWLTILPSVGVLWEF